MVYTKQEAAALLKISFMTIDRHRKSGKLPFHRIGDRIFFTPADLDLFLERTTATYAECERAKTPSEV